MARIFIDFCFLLCEWWILRSLGLVFFLQVRPRWERMNGTYSVREIESTQQEQGPIEQQKLGTGRQQGKTRKFTEERAGALLV